MPSLPDNPTNDRHLNKLIDQWRTYLHNLVDDSIGSAQLVILMTQVMREADAVNEWASEVREQAVYDLFYSDTREESMASVARAAGITPQALTRVLSIARSKRNGTDEEQF